MIIFQKSKTLKVPLSFPSVEAPFLSSMAMLSRLRQTLLCRRHFSTILSPDSSVPLSAKQKTRAALSLLRSESNPDKILEICRAAALTPEQHIDRVAFSTAISKLSKSNHFEAIREYLEELKKRPDLQTEKFAAHAIVLYGQANMIDHALRTFKEYHAIGTPTCSVKILNALLFSCIVANDYKEVKRIFVEFPKMYGINPNLETYNTVIKAFCESGSSSSVYSVLSEMDKNHVIPNAATFGIVLSGFYREEKLEDVEKILTMMRETYNIHPGRLSTVNVRIQALCKLKRSVEAKALFDGMIAKGTKPNSITYSHLIHGFCKEGNLEMAMKLYKNMIHKGCPPHSECYFTMVHFLCKGEDYESALQICKDSLEKNWVPNFGTMKLLVNGLASKASKVEEARELVKLVKDKFPNNTDLWDSIEAGFSESKED